LNAGPARRQASRSALVPKQLLEFGASECAPASRGYPRGGQDRRGVVGSQLPGNSWVKSRWPRRPRSKSPAIVP